MLAIALDPSVDRLRVGARTALRQKIANVLFVVARLEDSPCELDGAADRITVTFPWGSLLRGLVHADPAVLRPLARMARPGAQVEVLLSVEDRDAASGVATADVDRVARRRAEFLDAGLALAGVRAAVTSDLAGTTWGKRLGVARSARVLHLRRTPPEATGSS